MKVGIKFIAVLLLIVPLLTFAADQAVYPSEKDSEVIRNQKEIVIQGVRQSHICKAAIMAMMSYEVKDTSAKQVNPQSVVVTRYRRDDNTKWNWLCKVDSSQIIYAAMNTDGPQRISIGRWRTHPLDEKIVFNIVGADLVVTITYAASPPQKRAFSLKSMENWK